MKNFWLSSDFELNMESLGRIDINDIVQNRPLFSFCAALIVTLFGLNFIISDCTDRVGLVVANTLITNTYVWNLITSCFYEKYVAKFVVDLVLLLLLTKSLPIPSIEQFGLYFLFSILSCTIGTSVYCFFAFFTMARESSLITPIYGFSGVLMSILMFARHTYRNETVHSAFPKLTFHHLPILLYLTQVVLYFTWGSFLVTDLPFSTASLLFTWSYLRFYYKHTANSEALGDKSEDFSFVGMFPEALHIVLIPFTTAFYNIVALVGLFPALEVVEKKTYHHLRNVEQAEAGLGAGPTSSTQAAEGATQAKVDVVADRRRAKALKLLDAKMAELAQEPEGWDDVGAMGDLESLSMKSSGELSKLKV